MSADPAVLNETDVRAMVRLIGDIAAIPGGCNDKKRSLMEGLRLLIDADCWVWCLVADPTLDTPPVLVNFTHGGFDDDRFARFLEASQHPGSAPFTAPIVEAVSTRRTHQTRLRQQLVTTEDFRHSPAYEAWSRAGIGPVLLSIRPLADACQSAIGLYRNPDRPLFTPREARIAHIILSEISWLHELGWPEDRGATVPRLSPRQRLILNLLLEGRSRKHIASHLDISENTVAGYVKEIYRHFTVKSHAELLARFFQGDGGDGI